MSSKVIDKFVVAVGAMRDTVAFTVAGVSNGIYTLNAKHSLSKHEYILITGTEYQVSSVSDGQFQIKTSDTIEGGEYSTLSPYVMYGNKMELSKRLLEKESDKVYKYQKYPLIALNMPFVEEVKSDGMIEVTLNVAILNYTEETYISEERYEQVIKPILEPLYNEFLAIIPEYFQVLGVPEHTRVDRLFWGTSEDGTGEYIFNDPLDAIELINLRVKILNDKC